MLVSNTGQSNAGQTSVNPNDHAQGFTTGQNTLGYSLTSIELGVGVASGSGTLTVTVRGDDGSGDPGGNTLYTLNNPANVAAGLRTFTAPAGASLSANTQYFVQMVFAPNGSASYPRWDNTTSSLQDSASAIGWSIRNERHLRTPGSTGWGSTNFTVLQIRVNGQIRAPAAPMNLSAAPDDGQVTLSWANPANNTITKYQYRRKTDTGTYGSWTDIPNSGDTTTSYTVTGLTNGTEYTFRVRAVNAGGNGAASTVTATPAPVPAAPTKLEAEVGDRRIGLTWDDPGDSTIDEYEYSTDGGSFSVISGSDDATTSYTVTGLTNGTQYTFAVRAVNAVGNGAESSVTAKPLWPAPTGLVATPGQGRVTVEWNNGHDDIDDYYIYVYEDGVRRNTIFLPPGSGSTTTRTVYPLTNGTLYDFSVRALNGKESPTVTARPISMPAPENLTTTEGDDRQTTLSWSDPDNDTIYKYQVSMDGGTTFTDISGSSKSTTTTIVTGLTNGTQYTLAVRGVNWWGYGAASTATATPLWPAPANLVATPDSSRVFLEWDRNPGITDYRVDISDGNSVDVPAGSGSKTIAAIDSLANGTAYTFTVLATQDSAQDSADSSWPAAVDATPMVVSPDAPTNLSATPSNSQATLSWDDPGNNTITKYQVSRDGGTSFTNISDSGASTTTTTVTGLTNGILYTFAVRAENASGRGLAATTTATPVNDAPTASAKTVSTDEDTAYTFKGADFGFTSVKSGATLNHMKITALPGADKGTLSVGGTAITGVTTPRQVTKTGLDAGNLTYTPPANANGAAFATFAFKVNDGVADSDMAYTITINVNAVNDPLTGSDKTVSTDEDFSYTFGEADFAFSDVDAGATLGHVKITSLPGSNQGTLSVGDTPIASVSPPLQVTKDELGTLTYTPPTNAFGAAFATFNFKVSDGTDDSDKAYTITIDVNAVNDPPVAVTDNAETSEDIPVVIGVLENDSDVDPGTTLRVVEVGFPTAPSKGTAAINPNTTTVTYTPNANVTGTDTFSYAVTDGFDTSNVEVAVEILGSGTNANLSNLTISQGTLMPDFSATTTSYAVRVEALTDSVQVTPTTADAQATVTVNGALVDSGTASDDIALTENDVTRITVAVTAADGTSTQTTTIDVTRPLSDNANLSGLTISSGTLTPVFAVGTTDYRVDVGNAVDSVTVTPATEHAGATVTVNGTPVASGSASDDIALTENDVTRITVAVTAADGVTTKAYAIEVVRVLSVSFGAAAYEAAEGGDPVMVTVTLNQEAVVALTIPITVMVDTAETGDYAVEGLVNGALTFAKDDQEQTFTIKAKDDDDFDDETVTLSFGTLPPGAEEGKPATATLTIVDAEGAVVRARFRRLNNEILSKHALTLADVTIAAVTSRQEAGPRCADQATTGSLGGSSSLAEILTANAQTLTTGSLNLKQLLGTSAFRLRLTEDGAGPGCLTLWGQGDYRNLSSSDAQGLEWDGDLLTGQVGADALLQPDLRAGLAVSWSEGDFDYTDRTTGEPFSGDYTSRMMSVHPYLTWWSPAGLDVWATGGYGQGEIEIKDEEAGTHTSDTTLRLASVGASGLLPIGDALIAGGTTTLRVKAQASVAQMKVEGNGSLLEEQTIEAQRLRLALEGSHERTLASGGSLTPSFEVGLRHDGGDGATGTGLELGGGLRYVAPALGLTVEGRGRVLAAYEENYEEWGASGLIRLDPGLDRQGLSFSLVPSYGQTASGVQRLWDQGLTQGSTQGPSATQAPTGRLEAEVGYGLVAFAGQGLVTPYSAVILGGGTQQYRVGSRLELGPALRLSLEGTRQVTTVGQADQGIRLQVDWQF